MPFTIQTQQDDNLRECKYDALNGFDPLAVLGFSIKEPKPDQETIISRHRKAVRIVAMLHTKNPDIPFSLADVNRARDNLLLDWDYVVERTISYHKPRWNLEANEHDLVGLLHLPPPYVARLPSLHHYQQTES